MDRTRSLSARLTVVGRRASSSGCTREGTKQTVTTRIDSLFFTGVVEDSGPGKATVDVTFHSHADISLTGIYFAIELPGEDYAGGTVEWSNDFFMLGPGKGCAPRIGSEGGFFLSA